jgi:ABC-2 type transport system permease protein
MNNKLFILTKALLKNGFGIKATGKKKVRQIIFIILISLCFVPLLIGLSVFISTMYDALKVVEQEGIILSLGIAVSSFVIFFFGVFYVINIFYFSDDVEILLPLPLKSSEIIGAKFLVTVVYEYLTELILLLPLFVIYAYKSGPSFMYYIYALVVFLLVPVVPLSIASVLVMIIMRFTAIAKNRDRFKMVGGLIAMFGAIGFNTVIQQFAAKSIDPQQLQEMFTEGQNSMVELMSRIFPGTKFAALSIVHNTGVQGIVNLMIFLLIAVASFLIFLYFGELLYFRGVIGISEQAAKRKKVSREELGKLSVLQSKLKAYTIKELKLLFRTPIYFMNCVLINFLFPIFMLIPLLTQSEGESELESIKAIMNIGIFDGIIVVVGFAAAMLISTINSITSTSISREGQNLYISKYLPVSYKTQILAKALSGAIVSFIGVVTILISVTVFLELPLYLSFMIAGISLFGIVCMSFIGVMIDLFHPKLNWDNEQKAVKQNLNPLFHMLLATIFCVAAIWASIAFFFSALTACAVIIFAFGVIDFLLYKLIATKGVKLFSDIEV